MGLDPMIAAQIKGSQAAIETVVLRFRSLMNNQRMNPANKAAANWLGMRLHVPFPNRIQADQRQQPSGMIHELDQILHEDVLARDEKEGQRQPIERNCKQ